MKKILQCFVIALMIACTALPVLGETDHYNKNNICSKDVTLEVLITTDYVIDYQNHGLRVREFELDQEVWVYAEVSGDDLFGVKMTHEWWYDTGTGIQNRWSWSATCDQHWTGWATWTYWAIGLDYGKGEGYVKLYIDDEYVETTNWYAVDNTKPDTPTIDGDLEGNVGEEYEYKFTGTDPDGFDISYYVDWGDETNSGWTDYVPSGTDEFLTHIWEEEGDYIIQCKIRDRAYNESDWATFEITMPVSQQTKNYPILEGILSRFPNAFSRVRQFIDF